MAVPTEPGHRSKLINQDSRNTRVFLHAPQSTGSFVSAFLEPVLIIAAYIGACLWYEVPIDRPGTALCLLVFALSFPGVDRFRERPLNAAADVLVSWMTLASILALCGYATDSFRFFDRQVLTPCGAGTPVLLYVVARVGRL